MKTEKEGIIPKINSLLPDKKIQRFQTKPVIIALIAVVVIIFMLLMLSQKVRPSAQNSQKEEKYVAATPSRELIRPSGEIVLAEEIQDQQSPDSVRPSSVPESFFTYDAKTAENGTAHKPNSAYEPPQPPAAYQVQQYDQAKEAVRQQKMEMIRAAYTARPMVDGDWPKTEIKTHDTTMAAQSTSNQQADIKTPTDRLIDRLQDIPGGMAQETAAGMSAKEQFFSSSGSAKGYLKSTREAPISPYTIPSGSMIPCALISGINSDLPGNITATVTENVYDWAKPHVCLIPQGSRVFGEYDSNIAFAQKRIQIKWTRLTYPDGSVIDLDGMPGVDRSGYTGLKDKFYGHYGRMLTAALLTTAIGLIPEWIEDRDSNETTVLSSGGQTIIVPNNYTDDFRNTAASEVARSIGRVGDKFFDKALNVDPTILIRPGMRFNIQVNADIPFYRAW